MSVLLLAADYYGTLAAARCFGRHGIEVNVADETSRGRTFHSRFVTGKEVHPPLSEPAALVDWLVAWGRRHPGTMLYAPNDHLAWLFAAERERLCEAFSMLVPEESAVLALLDKKRLHDACAAVGIDVPATTTDDAAVRFPVLLKPRTQVFLESGVKGFIARDRAELDAERERFRQLAQFHRVLTSRHPEIAEPLLQEYLTAAETNIFSVSGFVAPGGDVVMRAATKVLQRPRKVGIGLCFESAKPDPVSSEKLVALCKHVGYVGAFEAEFIVDGARRLLIDFNPRFYSQMGFDIARGMPLPLLVYYAARGDEAALARTLDDAKAWTSEGREAYCHKTMLDLVITLQGLSGEMSRDDVRRWRAWYRDHRSTMTDAVRDRDDMRPAIVDATSWATHFAKHPRSFVRNFVRNR